MNRDILAEIAAYKRHEVAERQFLTSLADMGRRAAEASPPRGFRAALQAGSALGRPALIAEIKKASPSKGLIRSDFDPASHARAYELGGAACLSVLTDGPSFQGADTFLVEAREACGLPVLRKEFLVDAWQVLESRALGADAILVIMAMADDALAADLLSESRRLGMDVLVEVHDAGELRRAADLGADLIGVNNRDLRTFRTDLEVTERLSEKCPPGALLVSESGIYTRLDAARVAAAGARAILVGESLMRQHDLEAATHALVSA